MGIVIADPDPEAKSAIVFPDGTKRWAYDRYMALNLTHLWEDSPHLEFRHHQGTLNVTTACMWLRFCLELVQHACNRNCQAASEPTANDRRGIEALLTVAGFKVNTKVYCKVAPELRECGKFMLKRWKGFNGNCSLRQTKAATSIETAEVD
ncbi:MAG: amidoligase family protein [Bacillota bacterium]